MGTYDIILLVITVLLIVEAVIEARRKNWLALAISIAFLALVIFISRNIYIHYWKKVFPPTPATAPQNPPP